ncbi:MAG: response regulator transcription factor [Clostridiales bacterium]|nr:response regulator transcription factor [Clostridiales bacterium]
MRLLLADDERELTRALEVILSHEGYEVQVADDGREALAYAQAEAYDGYIFDIMMPVMDGITLLETLRAAGDQTPAIFLTAKSATDDTIRGLDAGANDYLTKPFAMGELLARVRALLRRAENAAPKEQEVHWANVLLDCRSNMLQGSTMRLALAPDEAKLLRSLIEHAGQPIAHSELHRMSLPNVSADTLSLYLDYIQQKLDFVGAAGHLVRDNGTVYLKADL